MSQEFGHVLRHAGAAGARPAVQVQEDGFVEVGRLLQHFETYTMKDVKDMVQWSSGSAASEKGGARFDMRCVREGCYEIRSVDGHAGSAWSATGRRSRASSGEPARPRSVSDVGSQARPGRQRSPRGRRDYSRGLSKAMAKVLRHSIDQERDADGHRVIMTPEGFVPMRGLLRLLRRHPDATAEDVMRVVDLNVYRDGTPRFEVRDSPSGELIRASGKHTVAGLSI